MRTFDRKCSLDFETYSEVDLKACGLGVYARHASTRALMVAYTLNEAETIQHWHCHSGKEMPNELLDALQDERVLKSAYNAAFEQNITEHVLGIPVYYDEWTDPMIVARSLSLPGSLAEVCRILNLPEDLWKHATGKALINFWCKPRKPTKTDLSLINDPSRNEVSARKWREFCEYNKQDVRAEVAVWNRMKRWTLSDWEWRLWEIDREINEAGVPVNLRAIDNANRIVDALTEKSLADLQEITGLQNANSGEQLLGWLKERAYPFNDMKIGHVRRALKDAREEGDGETDYAIALQRRTEVSKASVKKYAAYQKMATGDGLLRNMFMFNGAGRTCRWAGSGVQVHNMARPHWFFEKAETQEALARAISRQSPRDFEWRYALPLKPGERLNAFEALSSGVRGVIAAPDGYVFVSADFNAIENRVLGYMASEERILNVFKQDRCPYIDFATYMFGGTYDELYHEYKVLGQKIKRQTSKPGVLGAGYMLGEGHEYEDPATGEIMATGLLGYGRAMGINLTVEQSSLSVKVWRDTFSKCVDLWYELDKAFRKAINTGRRVECEMFEFEKDGPFVTMRLPSGRKLYYLRPRIEDKMKPWGEIGPTITYEGIDSRTGRKTWGRISTHPGKITENADQALARDCLAEGIVRVKDRGVDVRMHIHDEIVALAREDDAERVAKIMSEEMSREMEWAPGLPLKAVAEISKVFVKT